MGTAVRDVSTLLTKGTAVIEMRSNTEAIKWSVGGWAVAARPL